MAARQKVAILGGGIGSTVAAFELTSTPELRARYEVTVYQLGWRLGGKCASGRNPHLGDRIEEHGLHIWFGFYENAFRVIREAYGELRRRSDAPLATWRDAFKPCDDIVLYEEFAGRWRGWSFDVPRNPLTPGEGDELPQFWEIAHTMLDYLLGRWGALKATSPHVARAAAPAAHLPFAIDRLAGDALSWLLRRAHPERAIFEALQVTELRGEAGFAGAAEPAHRSLLWGAIDLFKRWLWKEVVEPHLGDDDVRFFFTMFDAGTTLLQGILEDRLIERGFDAVNDEDLREWMLRHGAQRLTVDQGPFVRALYDMAFAYESGDVARPTMAAGTAVHDMLRLFFTYRGAFAWKMQAGMGDTVFTPLYEVLKRRGVRFEFFHWVTELGLSPDRSAVDRIEVVPQVTLRDDQYDPLVEVRGLGCWPSEPRWDQIEEGERLRREEVDLESVENPLGHASKTLRRGEHFDLVVLGISVAALPPICRELIEDERNPRFRTMIENSHTVMTQAFQVWLDRPVERLGWPFRENSIMTAYVEPLDTYADMSQLLVREAWPPERRVEDVAYFCGVLEDLPGDDLASATARAHDNAVDYLRRYAAGIWHDAAERDGEGFNWGLLVDGSGARGPARFDSQFWRANFQPSERYVLTPPRSVRHRLAADESGYENLFLAGDWIKNGLDAGCVEAAVMGGMQAARAISGVPQAILGEDHGWLGGEPVAPMPPARPRMPRYVDYGGLGTCPSPVDCDDATLYGFLLEADHQCLKALCDRVFAQPSDRAVDVRPLGSHVMLSFGIVRRIRPRLEPWASMGFATERQVAFWVPVVAIRRDGGLPIAASLGWFVPYMWVDNPLSLTGGREIYGFNKNWGWIGLPNGDPDRLTLDAYGGDFVGDMPAKRRRLIKVTRASSGSLDRGADGWDDLAGLVQLVRRTLRKRRPERQLHPELELPDSVFEAIVRREGPPQIFLKQFRSVSDGTLASQQQITDGGVTLKRISGRPLLSEFQFELRDLDSHPVAHELGVESPQTTALGFEVEMDFVLNDGRVLWQASPGQG